MSNAYPVRLNSVNEERFEEIKNKLQAENLLSRNSTNEVFNFIVREFSLLFLGEDKKSVVKQELAYLSFKSEQAQKNSSQSVNRELLNKVKFIDENLEIALYILLALNYGTNQTEFPEETFKSIMSDGNEFSSIFDKAKKSVERDKIKAHKLKRNYE